MEELVEILREIRDEIRSMNSNIEELVNSVNDIKGTGLFNSVSDVCDKLDAISSSLSSIDINTTT